MTRAPDEDPSSDSALIDAALADMLAPLVGMLLRNGVTYQHFCALAKAQFVAEAQRDFGVRGRPTNSARISAITGIDRKEVKRLKEQLVAGGSPALPQAAQDKMSRLVRAWHEDKAFLLADGTPALLSIEGDEPSFKTLARLYGGGMPVKVVLKELMRAQVVVEVGDRLQITRPFYSPPTANPEALVRAGGVVKDLGSTLLHNIYRVAEKKRLRPRFERRAFNRELPTEHADAFTQFLHQQGQAFLVQAAEWLDAHENPSLPSALKARVGVGLYGIYDETDQNEDV
jgi:hypothetical protein